ncbi:hypothetical protein [Pedobacter sp. JCM 36344]|uniref:hypothetical protein n=1 Tax=Pedobacter sp. JCM 36344 TaxID=3374280 RepID=UPI00397AC720
MKTLKKLSLFDLSKEQITLTLAEMQEIYGGGPGDDCVFQTLSYLSAFYGGTSGYNDYNSQYSGDSSYVHEGDQAKLLNRNFEGYYIASNLSGKAVNDELAATLSECKAISVNLKHGTGAPGSGSGALHNVAITAREANGDYRY